MSQFTSAAPDRPDPSLHDVGNGDVWLGEFHDAIGTGRVEQAAQMLEDRVVNLLGRGRSEDVRTLVAEIPRGHRSLLLQAAAADAATRSHEIDLATLDALERSVQHTIDLRAFVIATKAQYLLWRGDPLCLSVALSGLDILPREGLISPVGLLARGRIKLFLAIGTLLTSAAEPSDAGSGLLEEAVADLTRAGVVEEAAAAQAYYYALAAMTTWTGVVEAAHTVEAAAQRLARRDSAYTQLALVATAHLYFLAGDLASSTEALAAAMSWDGPTQPFVPYLASYVELVRRLLAQGPGPELDALAEDLVAGLDAYAPELAGGITITIGDIHADLGDDARARLWAARARQVPLPLPADLMNRQVLDGRVRIMEGAIEEGLRLARAGVETLRNAGTHRVAAVQLARVARSLRRAGAVDVAASTREEAARVLTAPLTIWEAVLLGPEPAGAPPMRAVGSPATRLHVRALAPDISVTVDGRVCRLGPLHARIVGRLLAADRPLTTDELIDAVWPDLPIETARHRLAVALHRMRTSLDIDGDLLVERDGNGVRLTGAEHGCTSDFGEFMATDPDDIEAARRALLSYADDFVARQLAYEDWAIETRRWVRARFIVLATRVLEAHIEGAMSGDAIAVALHARRAALDDARLATAIVTVLAGRGRHAEAAALVSEAQEAAVFNDRDLDGLRRALEGREA